MQIQEVFDRRRFVFLDGGMGTQLQQRGLQPGQKPELAALEMPDVLTAIHRDYTAAGADILNVSGASRTPEIVTKIRAEFPTVPIIATGGPREEDILRTIEAGANAITYTPPTTGQLFADIMISHRKNFSHQD